LADVGFARPKFSRTYTISIFAGRLSIQSEFSFQTPKFNGRPEHRCYFPVGTRAQLDDPISRAAAIRFGNGPPAPRYRTMKMKYFLAALLLVPSLAMSATAQARTNESSGLPQVSGSEGREVAAPPWSAACMTDHGPSQCGEPMWIYGGRGALARYKNAF
jgi:hypothetical protein